MLINKSLGLFRLIRWKKGSQLNQLIMAVLVTFPTLTVGMVVGWVSPAIPQLLSADGPLPEPISQAHLGWMASASFLVSFFLMLLCGLLADTFGRKMCMLIASLSIAICWLLKVSYLRSEMIIIARAIAGIGTAIAYVVSPMYVKEISDDNIRGALCSMVILLQNTGFVISYIIGAVLPFHAVLWVSFVLPLLHLVVFVFAPDSPSYLVKKKKIKEATEVLAWLRSVEDTEKTVLDDINKLIADETQQINIEEKEIPAWKVLVTDRTTLKAFVIVAVILMAQECCGYLVLLTYASEVFTRANVGSKLDANQQTIVLGFVQLAGSVVACCLVEKVGRRPLLAIMSFLTGLGMLTLGSWFYASTQGLTVPGWLPISAMCLSIFSTAAGFQPTPFVILPEMFNFKLRGLVSSITVSLTALGDFIQTEAYQPVTSIIGLHGTFWIFSVVCFLGTAFTVAFVPETRNKSVEEIYAGLRGKKKSVKSPAP